MQLGFLACYLIEDLPVRNGQFRSEKGWKLRPEAIYAGFGGTDGPTVSCHGGE